MELPIKFPIPSGCWPETFYTIETKNLYYKISTHFDDVNLACFGGSSRRSPNFILKDVNFEARPGDITAIAGPSGAGKTTLLEILAGRISPKKVCGQVLVNSKAMDTSFFRKISGYVTQVDALFPLLTVEETLMYSARLRLRGAHKERATTKVRQLLKELGLEHVASSRIGEGSMINSISGGERRRVSIGVDLVHDPDVILIDEPTSGLDSISALHLISLLKSMVVYQGKTIVLTIHQPGYRILEQFDHIVLLSNGNVAHHGTLTLLEQNLKMFGHCIPKHVNVLEFAIDVVDTLILQNKYVENKMRLALSNNLDEKFISYPNSRLNEIVVLGERFYNNISRSKQLFATRVIQAIVAGFVLGTIFLNVGGDEGKNALQTQTGFFAFSLTFLLSTTTEGLPIFLQERRILVSEIERGAYRISSYVIANTIVFLPFLLMVCLLYTTPVYWLVGLRKDIDRFLYFCLIVWMVLLMSNSFVACFSALVPNFIMGTSVIAGLMGSFFLFSGYFIAKKSIPSYWIFMHYLSLFKYPFECFLINEYAQGDQGTRRCVKIEEKHCILYGDEFLEQQGLKGSQKWTNLIVMLGFIIGYRVLCFLILWCKCYNRTRK